jgi:diguanylate cyclase (GGDEF)-like protein
MNAPMATSRARRQLLPFSAVAGLGLLLAALPGSEHNYYQLGLAALVDLLCLGISSLVVTGRLPRRLMVPNWLVFLGGVALLRHSAGGSQAGVGLLALLPCVWMAMYGSRRELGWMIAGMTAVFVGPIVLIGGDQYPASGLRGAILSIALTALISTAMHEVITDERDRSEDAEELARTDELTGLPNRRQWDSALPDALAAARRDGMPVAVIVLDLNAFKELNDQQGHQLGDQTLKACAAAWRPELRAADLLARLGGDEFAALLPGCDELNVSRLSERLREATPHVPGVSVGAAVSDGHESPTALLARADGALYADKRARLAAQPSG